MRCPPLWSGTAFRAVWIVRKAFAQLEPFELSPSLDTKRVVPGCRASLVAPDAGAAEQVPESDPINAAPSRKSVPRTVNLTTPIRFMNPYWLIPDGSEAETSSTLSRGRYGAHRTALPERVLERNEEKGFFSSLHIVIAGLPLTWETGA